jgi:hypothetical protein
VCVRICRSHSLGMFGIIVLRRIFGHRREEVNGGQR